MYLLLINLKKIPLQEKFLNFTFHISRFAEGREMSPSPCLLPTFSLHPLCLSLISGTWLHATIINCGRRIDAVSLQRDHHPVL